MKTITISKLWIVHDDPYLKAVCSILIDGQLAIHDIRLVENAHGNLAVYMPCQPDKHGRARDVVHPIVRQLRQLIDEAIIYEYEKQKTEV